MKVFLEYAWYIIIFTVLTIGWGTTFTNVSEDVGTFELCAEVKHLASTQVIGYDLQLAPRLILLGGTSGMFTAVHKILLHTMPFLACYSIKLCLSVEKLLVS